MDQQYSLRIQKIEEQLDKWLPEKPGADWASQVLPGLIKVPDAENFRSLTMPCRDLLSRGGKRWRPLLMVLAAESIAGESAGESAVYLTPLVEFPHNASLIHDDIEDNSDERRGKPAVHLLYGTDTAINGGAFMYFLPLACLSAWTGTNTPETAFMLIDQIWKTWACHMRALHLGQAMDIAWHRDFYSLPALDEYDRMCRLKTGCLARLAAVLGVYSAGIVCEDGQMTVFRKIADALGGAAEQLGVGFQILDDVKNLDTGVPGKKRGDDIVEGKKSLPVLLYLHRYPEKRDFAARCFASARAGGTDAPEVEELILAFESAGVLAESREKGLEYIRESRRIFSAPCAAYPLLKEGQELIAGLIDSLC
jgi:octaprenyl-diphosphate synthase